MVQARFGEGFRQGLGRVQTKVYTRVQARFGQGFWQWFRQASGKGLARIWPKYGQGFRQEFEQGFSDKCLGNEIWARFWARALIGGNLECVQM